MIQVSFLSIRPNYLASGHEQWVNGLFRHWSLDGQVDYDRGLFVLRLRFITKESVVLRAAWVTAVSVYQMRVGWRLKVLYSSWGMTH